MTDLETMAANLRNGARNGVDALIGGGVFNAGECREAAAALDAYPVLLAALHGLMGDNRADNDGETVALLVKADAYQAALDAIALATGAPTGEQAPPVDMDGKRTDTWNLVPGAQPEADEGESEGLATYRITETATYLVKAEDEAHAERRFVCEVGIHADCFHAVEGRTIELVEEGEG